MDTVARSHTERATSGEQSDRTGVAVRESGPGRAGFVEDGDTDGWVASDQAVEVPR